MSTNDEKYALLRTVVPYFWIRFQTLLVHKNNLKKIVLASTKKNLNYQKGFKTSSYFFWIKTQDSSTIDRYCLYENIQ